MLDVFARAGFSRHQLEAGVVELLLDIDDPSGARPAIVAREHVADVASMHRLLQPEGIVFVTGPPEQDAIGRALATRLGPRRPDLRGEPGRRIDRCGPGQRSLTRSRRAWTSQCSPSGRRPSPPLEPVANGRSRASW